MGTRIPVVLHAAVVSQAMPVCAAFLRRGRPLSAPARAVLVWCTLLVLSDALGLITAYLLGENQWVQYLTVPLESGIALWVLSDWQTQEVMRIAYRVTIPILIFITAAVSIALRPAPAFDQLLAPFHSLVLLAASLYTLVHRTLLAEQAVTEADWFWITLGMSLTFGTDVAVRPFAEAFIMTRPDWVADAYITKGWVDILAFLLITRGILRASLQPRFGGSS